MFWRVLCEGHGKLCGQMVGVFNVKVGSTYLALCFNGLIKYRLLLRFYCVVPTECAAADLLQVTNSTHSVPSCGKSMTGE